MPVDNRTHQAYGIITWRRICGTGGNAWAALVRSWSWIPNNIICVGVEINANHIRSVRDGIVTGTAIPLHLGASSHVWEIKIMDKNEKLVCVSSLTVFVKKESTLKCESLEVWTSVEDLN